MMWECIGKVFVGCVIVRISWSILKGIYGSFLGSATGMAVNFKKNGEWAIVTGATDGIGKEYAFEMPRQKLNVVLISRTLSKLQKVATEIKSKHNVAVKTLEVDFTRLDIYDRIKKELFSLDVGVVINNVAMSYEYPEYFVEVENCMRMNEDLINCNVKSVTQMTALFLPSMIQRKRGVIINISSFTSMVYSPMLSVYAATKSFVTSFSRNLFYELQGTGVTVQCIAPALLPTKMSRVNNTSLFVPSCKSFVRNSLKTTGIESVTTGHYMHKLQAYVGEVVLWLLPGWFTAMGVFVQMTALKRMVLEENHKKKIE